MNTIRSVWALTQGDARCMRRVNGWLTILWVVMIPVSYTLGWFSSVAYVSALSLWALVSGHWAAWQAARVEVAQQREHDKQIQSPMEERVVERLVQETELERSQGSHSTTAG